MGHGIWDMGYGTFVRLGTKDTWPRGVKMRSSKVIRTSLPYGTCFPCPCLPWR